MSNLGLVCITTNDEVRFRTITKARLNSLDTRTQESTLRELYRDNSGRLARAIDFCARRNIHLYRAIPGLFPHSEEAPGLKLLEELGPQLGAIGERATRQGVRIVMHPDQFVLLSSDSKKIVENGVGVLRHQARVLDLLRQPQTTWTALQILGGKSDRGDQLLRSIRNLPEEVKLRLALVNDDAYGAAEMLSICQTSGVPMVFDAHAHVCREGLASYEDPSVTEMTRAARTTWTPPEWQLVHLANGRDSFADPKHADFIETVPSAFRDVEWVEVEAKKKEQAIERLRRVGRTAARMRDAAAEEE